MSQRKYLTSLLLASLVFFGACKKETTKDVSRIFKVPSLEIIGEKAIALPIGGTFTDDGATYLSEDGAESTVEAASDNIDNTTPGLYLVQYEETSASGIYESSAERVVAVSNVNNPIDYTGTYFRAATGINMYITKVANGLYKVQNPGGAAAGVGIVVYMAETAPGVFVAPSQDTPDGPFGINEISISGGNVSWKVANAGYGTGVRTFVKQ